MSRPQHANIGGALQIAMEDVLDGLRGFLEAAIKIAMLAKRERFIGAGRNQRSKRRKAYANGYKPKRLDTNAGKLSLRVPKTAEHQGLPFYPNAFERERRSCGAPHADRRGEAYLWRLREKRRENTGKTRRPECPRRRSAAPPRWTADLGAWRIMRMRVRYFHHLSNFACLGVCGSRSSTLYLLQRHNPFDRVRRGCHKEASFGSGRGVATEKETFDRSAAFPPCLVGTLNRPGCGIMQGESASSHLHAPMLL